MLNMELSYDPTFPLLGIYPKELKTGIQTMHARPLMFIAALFTIARKWKQPTCSSRNIWINKLWYVHTM